MRAAPLTTIKGGINRLRLKGGARADNLYDLLNGYVKDSGSVVCRPGTLRKLKLDPLTRGLCSFNGVLHTFCHTEVYVPAGVVLKLIVHPDITPTLEKIHFAEPFMGALYVSAEFSNGDIYHYWLQQGEQWQASKQYDIGDLVYPSTPTGLVYRAKRLGSANPPWAADVPRYDGSGPYYYTQSTVEPTVYNGFYYTCIMTTGSDPRSGTTEPTWPTADGGTVVESTDNPPDANIPTTTTDATAPAPTIATILRYGLLTNRFVSR